MIEGEVFEVDGLRFVLNTEPQHDVGTPWEEYDDHGPVSNWTQRNKKPGERVLSVDHSSRRYYDFEAAIAIAKRDGWSIANGSNLTKSQIAVAAVEDDFKRLKAWCNDEWYYIGVMVTLLNTDYEPTEFVASLWSIESDDYQYIDAVAKELAEELAAKFEGVSDIVTTTNIRRKP